MSIKGDELAKMSMEEIAANTPERCVECGIPIVNQDESIQAGYCQDCYYKVLGEEIEKRPIFNPERAKYSKKR